MGKKRQLTKSSIFTSINPDIEDEILKAYSEVLDNINGNDNGNDIDEADDIDDNEDVKGEDLSEVGGGFLVDDEDSTEGGFLVDEDSAEGGFLVDDNDNDDSDDDEYNDDDDVMGDINNVRSRRSGSRASRRLTGGEDKTLRSRGLKQGKKGDLTKKSVSSAADLSNSTSIDLLLKHLPLLFQYLKIPSILTYDIISCIDHYYEILINSNAPTSLKDNLSLCLINYYTITSNPSTLSDIIDIIDIDKLIYQLHRLIILRNNYDHIHSSWLLFTSILKISKPLKHKLTLPDLKKIKSHLGLDSGSVSLSDSVLIDMLSCAYNDSKQEIVDLSGGPPGVGFKAFGLILGELGELE